MLQSALTHGRVPNIGHIILSKQHKGYLLELDRLSRWPMLRVLETPIGHDGLEACVTWTREIDDSIHSTGVAGLGRAVNRNS